MPLYKATKTDFLAPETLSSVAFVVPAIKRFPVELSWSTEKISVSPELNPKVNGNFRSEQFCALTSIFT